MDDLYKNLTTGGWQSMSETNNPVLEWHRRAALEVFRPMKIDNDEGWAAAAQIIANADPYAALGEYHKWRDISDTWKGAFSETSMKLNLSQEALGVAGLRLKDAQAEIKELERQLQKARG